MSDEVTSQEEPELVADKAVPINDLAFLSAIEIHIHLFLCTKIPSMTDNSSGRRILFCRQNEYSIVIVAD